MAIPQLIASEPLKFNTNKCELFVDGIYSAIIRGTRSCLCLTYRQSSLLIRMH